MQMGAIDINASVEVSSPSCKASVLPVADDVTLRVVLASLPQGQNLPLKLQARLPIINLGRN
jgi:hypothetical protein